MKYAFMKLHIRQFKVSVMARILGVSRSGYYAWRQREGKPSKRQQARARLDRLTAVAFAKGKRRNGSPRLTRDLAEDGHRYDRKTVAGSMQRQNLVAKAGRKFKATTMSDHGLAVAPNLLEQDFGAGRPNEKYVGDITYLWTDEGWLYLAVVLDLYSRKVVGWAMDKRMKSKLVCDALTMALWRRGKPTGVIVHTDRGSQYCSTAYQRIITGHGLKASMSAKGCCYDNAVAESFFHSLKVEAIFGERFRTREQMRQHVFEYIEVDYNRNRRHSANGYISPDAFEALKVA